MKFAHLLLLVFGLSFSISQAQDSKDIEKQKSKLTLAEEEKLTGDFATLHGKYVGKVVFSNSVITRESPESKFITTYTFGDKLHVRGFFPRSILNSKLISIVETGKTVKEMKYNYWDKEHLDNRYFLKLYLDGNYILGTRTSESPETLHAISSLSINETLNDDESESNFGKLLYKELKNKVDLLTPGRHKLKLEFTPASSGYDSDYQYKSIAIGEIDMIVKDRKIDLNDPDVCLPIAQMNDKILEGKILKAFKAKGFKAEPKKVRIVSKKWNIIRNEYGIILRRYVEAYIGYSKNGKCYYDTYNFNQDYDGSGYQDEVYLMGEGIGTERERSCECLK
ncbi:hypothetical protein ACFQO9_19670 [Chryseobacterium zhengzhouense]|uniref:YARHG domain-containing protein n=1 Tax=Chryseobacterium zhengzhouense TaxID=1636086 RepID=A0ABW2M5Z8_9FLAO